MFSSINKTFGCCSKIIGCSYKKNIFCSWFCCCNNTIFFRELWALSLTPLEKALCFAAASTSLKSLISILRYGREEISGGYSLTRVCDIKNISQVRYRKFCDISICDIAKTILRYWHAISRKAIYVIYRKSISQCVCDIDIISQCDIE